MAVNRMFYAAALVGSIVFYFASSTWFSWLVLLLMLALPILSLLLSLPAVLTARLTADLPRRVEQGEAAMLHLHLRSSWNFPLPDARVRVNLRTREQARDVRYLSRLTRADGVLPLSTEQCGCLMPEFEKAQVYDALGLFCFRIKRPRPLPMAILPPPRKPDPMPELDRFLNQQLKAKNGGGFAEAYDHRPYRPGDPVKGIHWKLSLKSDQTIVREPLEPVKRRIVLAVCTPRDQGQLARTLGAVRYLSEQFLEAGVAHTVVWMDGKELQRAEAAEPEDVPEILTRACCAPVKSYSLPAELPFLADWICRVGEEVV